MAATNTNTVARSLHELGLAAWFGGSLMGAVGLNRGAGGGHDAQERSRIVNEAWDRWTPVNAAAIGAHVVGAIGLTWANKGRVAAQEGVGSMSLAKSLITGAALGATAYARMLGAKVSQERPPLDDGTTPATPSADSAAALRQLSMLQWAIPALTGALLVMNSKMGEQQRPQSVLAGLWGRLL